MEGIQDGGKEVWKLCVQDLKWGILWGWPMDHLIVYDELEGRETQAEMNLRKGCCPSGWGQMA